MFTRYKNHRFLYEYAILLSVLAGLVLIFLSSDFFLILNDITGIKVFEAIAMNNYLIIRLGDVFVVFAIFMLFRSLMTNSTFLKIGQSTLSIYVIHFMILYGSFTGLGLYRFFNHELNPTAAIIGAIIFMLACSFAALQYEKHKASIKMNGMLGVKYVVQNLEQSFAFLQKTTKSFLIRIIKVLGLAKG
jgi:hypothetical protein